MKLTGHQQHRVAAPTHIVSAADLRAAAALLDARGGAR